MFEGFRGQRSELASRAHIMGKCLLELVSPSELSSEALSCIRRLDLRPSQQLKITREISLPHKPGDPFYGQIALAGLEGLAYIEEVRVPAHLLYP